jgi:hypothetical protein
MKSIKFNEEPTEVIQAGSVLKHMRTTGRHNKQAHARAPATRHDHQRWKKKKLEVLTVKLELCVCICREILGEIAQLLRQHRLATVEHSYNIQNELQELVPIQKSNATIAKSERVACSFFSLMQERVARISFGTDRLVARRV